MPSQRHFLYLLPRADPEELALPPCTCNGTSAYTPLQLKVRIPQAHQSSSSNQRTAAASGSSSAISSSTSTSPHSSSSDVKSRDEEDIGASTRGDTPITGNSNGLSSTSRSPYSTYNTVSQSLPSTSLFNSLPLSTRSARNQLVSWKLIAPQVTTLSTITNTYLLNEAFALSAIQAEGSTVDRATKTCKLHENSRFRNDREYANTQSTLSTATNSSENQYASRPSTSAHFPSQLQRQASAATSPCFDNLSSNSSPIEPGSPWSHVDESTSTSPQSVGLPPSSSSSSGLTLETIEELPANRGNTNETASSQSERAFVGQATTAHSPTVSGPPSGRRTSWTPAMTSNANNTSPSTMHRVFSSTSSIASLETVSMSLFSNDQSSTIEGGSIDTTASTGAGGRRKRVPTAYRKEMESVLFAQSAASSSNDNSASSRRQHGSSSSSSSSSYSPFSMIGMTASVFSDTVKDAGRASSSSRHPSSPPSAGASPNSTTTKEHHSEDPFTISRENVNVCHVSDLHWYLEKILWKLGMHRKGRKEFMSYWLARFSEDDNVALRFLTQDEIEAFAPIHISLVAPSPPPTPPAVATRGHNEAARNSAEFASTSYSTNQTLSSPIPPSHSLDRQASNVSSASSSSEHEEEGHSLTSCSLSRIGSGDSFSTAPTELSPSPTNSGSTSSDAHTKPQHEHPKQQQQPASSNPTPASASVQQKHELKQQPIESNTAVEDTSKDAYSYHRIHIVFQRVPAEEVPLFKHRLRYRSGSSTLGVIDWSVIPGIAPTEECLKEDRVRILHVSATDLGHRGHYFR